MTSRRCRYRRRIHPLQYAAACCCLRMSRCFVPGSTRRLSGPQAVHLQARQSLRPGQTCTRTGLYASESATTIPPLKENVEGSKEDSNIADTLARKAKQREVEAFKATLPRTDPILSELEKVGTYPASERLYKALKHQYPNTLSVIAEYWRKAPFALLGSLLEPKEWSKIYREAGASAIAINVDPVMGGSRLEDIQEMVAEQEQAQAEDVNAPVPIIATDIIVDPVQISRAKLSGAAAVTLRFRLNPADVTRQLVEVTHGLGMEVLMQVRSVDEAQAAVAMGVRLVMLIGNTRRQGLEQREHLGMEGSLIGFDLRRPKEYQYGLAEIEDAWILRDSDFHIVYVSNLLFQTPLDNVLGPTAVIRALRSKACHFLVDPLDWITKAVSEGSKETLGELLM